MLKRLFTTLPLLAFLLVLSPLANAANAFQGQWPLLPEGTAPAEGEIWGELSNGLRYVIVPTDSATEAVSLRLLVAAGLAQDEKGKAGTSVVLASLAEFGTKETSREALVQFKLANGMDQGAKTFFEIDAEHTLYRLDLELPPEGAVEKAVDLLGQIAEVPSFDAAAFAESRSAVAYKSKLGISYYEPKQGTLERVLMRSSPYSELGDNKISSEVESIEMGDVEAYWAKWYKADRMALVVTGVVDSAAVEAMVKAAFESLQASSELVPVAAKGGRFRPEGEIESTDSNSTNAGFWFTRIEELGSLFDRDAEADYYKLDFIGRASQSYTDTNGRLSNSVLAVVGNYTALSVSSRGSITKFLEQLLAADKVVHRLAEFGINERDFEQKKKDYLDLRFSFDKNISSKQWAPLVADRAVQSIVDQVPFRYGEAFSDYLQSIVSRLSIEEVRERCASLFSEKKLSYYLELPKAYAIGSRSVAKRLKGMRKGYDFAWEQAGETEQTWNFGSPFQSGGMVESTEIIRFEEFPILKYEFANKLRMNLIRTDAFPGRVHMNISFGNGTSELENSNPAFESLVRTLLLKSKIGNDVDAPTIREMLEAKGIEEVDGRLTKENLYWSGIGRDTSDVEDFLSSVILWVVAGDLDEEMFDEELEFLEKTVERSMKSNSLVKHDGMLYSEDARLRQYVRTEDIESLDYSSMQKWLKSVRESAYIEITIVGNVLPRTVLREVRKTFASTPNRPGKVLQPRHAKPVVWNEPGVVRDTFKMPRSIGNVTFLFPQVTDKSCSADRMSAVFLPLFEEHLRRALAEHPELAGNLSVELIGQEMIPLSNAIKVRIYCSDDLLEKAESLIMSAAGSFEASLTEESLFAAERRALIELKRISQSPTAMIDLFKQSQGKPKAFGCVLDLLNKGFELTFDEYKQVAKLQFAEKNARGAVLAPEPN